MPHAGIQVVRLFIDIHTGSAQGLTDARVQEMLARPVPMLGNNGKLAPNGKAEETKTAIALKEQEGSRAPAAGQPPEQTSVGSGAEGSHSSPSSLPVPEAVQSASRALLGHDFNSPLSPGGSLTPIPTENALE